MNQHDDDVFDAKLRERWGTPPPATPELRARILGATADSRTDALTRRRRVFTMAAMAAMVICVVSVGVGTLRGPVDSHPVTDELVWFDGSEDDDVDMDVTALFDLAELSDAAVTGLTR